MRWSSSLRDDQLSLLGIDCAELHRGRIQRDRRLRELEAEDQKTRTALAHLQGTVRAQHAELQSARKERDRAQSQLDEAREQLAECVTCV